MHYPSHNFARYQVPFGADQCKTMTRWALRRVKQKSLLPLDRFFGDSEVTQLRSDMWHTESGAEGVMDAELIHYT